MSQLCWHGGIEDQISDAFTDQYVERVLADPKANKLTTDDKTIVVAVRSKSLQKSSAPKVAPERDAPTLIPSPKSSEPAGPAPPLPIRPSAYEDRFASDADIHLVPNSTASRLVITAFLWLLNRFGRNEASALWNSVCSWVQQKVKETIKRRE